MHEGKHWVVEGDVAAPAFVNRGRNFYVCRLFVLKITEDEVKLLLSHGDSPYIRAVCFCQPPGGQMAMPHTHHACANLLILLSAAKCGILRVAFTKMNETNHCLRTHDLACLNQLLTTYLQMPPFPQSYLLCRVRFYTIGFCGGIDCMTC